MSFTLSTVVFLYLSENKSSNVWSNLFTTPLKDIFSFEHGLLEHLSFGHLLAALAPVYFAIFLTEKIKRKVFDRFKKTKLSEAYFKIMKNKIQQIKSDTETINWIISRQIKDQHQIAQEKLAFKQSLSEFTMCLAFLGGFTALFSNSVLSAAIALGGVSLHFLSQFLNLKYFISDVAPYWAAYNELSSGPLDNGN